ncbi:MAG: hypothetical protein ACRD4P_17530 [Bryobacteraceae bacterium]
MISAVLCALVLFAQAPPATGSLASEFRDLIAKQQAPGWIGYRVPATPGEHNTCWNSEARFPLESPESLVVLFRAQQGEIDKIRVSSSNCRIDTGGLPMRWIDNVRPEESVALLQSLAWQDRRDLANTELAAIALTETPDGSATRALIQLARWRGHPELQKQAFFWLAHSQDPRAMDFIEELLTK